MSRSHRCTTGLALAALLAPLCAQAQSEADRFVLHIGAMQAEGQSRFVGDVDVGGDEYEFTSDRIDLSDETVPRLEGMVRFSERNRLLFNYFRYDKDNRYTLTDDVVFDDTTIPAGSFAHLDTRFELGSAVYDFAVVETPTVSVGLQAGVEWARLKARARAEAGPASYDGSASEDGAAPVVGLRFSTNTADRKWRFTVQGQYLDADWGDFNDYTGDISRANAIVEYRFTEHFGVFAGYDWFKLDINKDLDDGNRLGLDQRFKGPTAGVTLAF